MVCWLLLWFDRLLGVGKKKERKKNWTELKMRKKMKRKTGWKKSGDLNEGSG